MARKQVNVQLDVIGIDAESPEAKGFYVGEKKTTVKGEERSFYILVTAHGERFGVWQNATLVEPMSTIKPGTWVELEYNGTKQTAQGRTCKIIDVFTDDEIKPSPSIIDQIDLPF